MKLERDGHRMRGILLSVSGYIALLGYLDSAPLSQYRGLVHVVVQSSPNNSSVRTRDSLNSELLSVEFTIDHGSHASESWRGA